MSRMKCKFNPVIRVFSLTAFDSAPPPFAAQRFSPKLHAEWHAAAAGMVELNLAERSLPRQVCWQMAKPCSEVLCPLALGSPRWSNMTFVLALHPLHRSRTLPWFAGPRLFFVPRLLIQSKGNGTRLQTIAPRCRPLVCRFLMPCRAFVLSERHNQGRSTCVWVILTWKEANDTERITLHKVKV